MAQTDHNPHDDPEAVAWADGFSMALLLVVGIPLAELLGVISRLR